MAVADDSDDPGGADRGSSPQQAAIEARPVPAVPRIDGHTRIIAHLGFPTETFKAPLIYNPYFAQRGIAAVVVPMGCRAELYPQFLRLLFGLSNIAGALITMPLKPATVSLVDRLSPTAAVAGACNAVRRDADGALIGDMFDGEGFVRGARRRGCRIAGARALVTGCGGVGSAIAASLAAAGAAELTLFDIDPAQMRALGQRLQRHFPGVAVRLGGNDPHRQGIVVNATPLGMNDDDELPFDTARLDPGCFVGEVVLKRQVTRLIAEARARGCRTQVGLDMLFEQIPAYLEFFGFPPASAEELRAVAQIAD